MHGALTSWLLGIMLYTYKSKDLLVATLTLTHHSPHKNTLLSSISLLPLSLRGKEKTGSCVSQENKFNSLNGTGPSLCSTGFDLSQAGSSIFRFPFQDVHHARFHIGKPFEFLCQAKTDGKLRSSPNINFTRIISNFVPTWGWHRN